MHNKSSNTAITSEYVQVSIGELMDKYSVLELKASQITDPQKLTDIYNEVNQLQPIVTKYMPLVNEEYTTLKDANKKIWDINDQVREGVSILYRDVMPLNDDRFKAKYAINIKCNSVLKEHKSYADLDYTKP